METQIIQFQSDDEIELIHVGELHGKQIYEAKRFDYDFENNEKGTLTISLAIETMNEKEKKRMLFLGVGKNKKQTNNPENN